MEPAGWIQRLLEHQTRHRDSKVPMLTARRLALMGLLAVLVLVALPVSGAGAHAILERTTPGQDSVVARVPARITLEFSEDVSAERDGVRFLDARDRPLRGGVTTVHGKSVTATFPAHVAKGTYTVSWRVISADSHPISGTFDFSIGHPSPITGPAAAGPGRHTDRVVSLLMGASRFAGYAGVVLCLGIFTVVLALWPAGQAVRRVARLVWCGWWLLAAGAIGGFLLQGPYGAGRSLGSLFDRELLSTTVDSRFGIAVLARLSVLLVLGVLLLISFTGLGERAPVGGGVAICGLSLLVSFGMAGHAGDGSVWSLAMLSDVVHIAAMAVWMGGLVLIIGCLLRAEHQSALELLLPRFSRWALIAFGAIAASGTFRAWQTVGTWAALPDTTYGRLLLGKIGGFLLLGVLGESARRWVRSRRQEGRHRAGLRAEVGIGAAVLVLTSILVGTAQANESYAPTRTVTSATDTTAVALTADPAHSGAATLILTVTGPQQAPLRIVATSATMACPAKGIAAVPIRFAAIGKGRARARVAFSVPCLWIVDLAVRTGPVEATQFRLRIAVR